MINFLKEQYYKLIIKRRLKDLSHVDKNFLRSARSSFVDLVLQRAGYVGSKRRHLAWRFAGVTLAVLFSMTGGMAAFAEKNDVATTHPLYYLKRISEEARLNISTPEKKLELHQVYANRRLKEISSLRANDSKDNSVRKENIPVRTGKKIIRVEDLSLDLEKEINNTIQQAERLNIVREKRVKICGNILEDVKLQIPSHSEELVEKIETRCRDIN